MCIDIDIYIYIYIHTHVFIYNVCILYIYIYVYTYVCICGVILSITQNQRGDALLQLSPALQLSLLHANNKRIQP